MIDKKMWLLVFLTVVMTLAQSSMWGAEPLPPRALARLGDHRFYHGPGIGCAILSPDGRRAAIHEMDYRLRVWNLETGQPEQYLSLDRIPLTTSYLWNGPQVFCGDGKTLLLAINSTLRLFDAATGMERGVPGHRAAITPRFSADGRTLFTSCDERRCRWDVSGKEAALLKHERRNVWEIGCLAHSADDRFFLDSPTGRLRLPLRVRETATGRVLSVLDDRDQNELDSVWFSPDAARVLLRDFADQNNPARKPALFRLYEAKTGKVSGQFKAGQEGYPVFSPNGRLVACADGAGQVHLHDIVSGKTVQTLRSSQPLPKGQPYDARLLFFPDGEQLIATLYLVDRSEPKKERQITLPLHVLRISSGVESARFYANPEKTSAALQLSCMACSSDGRLLAVAEYQSGIVRLLEIASGKVRAEFTGHRHGVHGLAFAPDGKTLASGGEDNVVFLWDVTGARTPATNKASDNDLSSPWNDLASEDGKRAGVAIAAFLRKPEASAAFLQEHLHPAENRDEKRLTRLLADLDDAAFDKREAASRELIRLGERAETSLRRALMNRPSLEMRRRIEDVMSKLEPTPLPAETLRTLRAIEVLEHIGTPAARRCLETLAKGAAEARPTREAKAALRRLAKHRG